MMTSDLRPEVKIWPFRTRAVKICNITIIIGTVWTWVWGRYHVPQNAFLVVIKIIVNLENSHKDLLNCIWGSIGYEG